MVLQNLIADRKAGLKSKFSFLILFVSLKFDDWMLSKNSEHYRIKCFRKTEKETCPFQKFNGSAKVSAKPAFHGEVKLSTHL